MKRCRCGRGQSRRTPLRIILPAVFLVVSLFLVITIIRDRDPQGLNGGKTAKSKTAAKKAEEPPLPDTLSIGFYNVENLFDFVNDGTEYDEYKPGRFGWTEDVYRTKLGNTAQVIAAIGVDIIGLCEIENMNVLSELQAELDKMGMPYPYAATAEAEGSSTVTAVLSRFPIRERRAHQTPVKRSRAILETLISRGGDSLVLFVNHWPSKRSAESARIEAAQVLRDRVDELVRSSPNVDYVILGDLNSDYNEFSTFHTAGFNDTKGKTGVNHVLKTIIYEDEQQRPLPVPRFVCKGELTITSSTSPSCINCHYNLWRDLEESDRMSYVFRGAKNTIDHILMPASMFDTAGYAYLDGSFEAFTWDGKLMRDGAPYRWQMNFRGKQRYHVGAGYSDHLPIRAKLVKASLLTGSNYGNDTDGDIANTNTVNTNIFNNINCDIVDPKLRRGDFAVTVDGWMSGDSRFTVARDTRFARTGTHSLRVEGLHPTENRTAAKIRFQQQGSSPPKSVSMSIRGSGKLSVRLRRPNENWINYNAPDFKVSKSARYKDVWRANSWVDLKFPIPPSSAPSGDVELELRAGKGDRFTVWIDRVRLE